MEKKFLSPKGIMSSPAFSQVVTVSGGQKTIYVSGQVPMDEKGELVGRGDIRAQTRKVFENMKVALAAAGAGFDDLVKVTYFIVGYTPELLGPIREVRSEYLSKTNPPSSTLVGIEKLFVEGVLIEVEAIAILG